MPFFWWKINLQHEDKKDDSESGQSRAGSSEQCWWTHRQICRWKGGQSDHRGSIRVRLSSNILIFLGFIQVSLKVLDLFLKINVMFFLISQFQLHLQRQLHRDALWNQHWCARVKHFCTLGYFLLENSNLLLNFLCAYFHLNYQFLDT